MIAGEITVWRIRLDEVCVPPPTPEEAVRAARERRVPIFKN